MRVHEIADDKLAWVRIHLWQPSSELEKIEEIDQNQIEAESRGTPELFDETAIIIVLVAKGGEPTYPLYKYLNYKRLMLYFPMDQRSDHKRPARHFLNQCDSRSRP